LAEIMHHALCHVWRVCKCSEEVDFSTKWSFSSGVDSSSVLFCRAGVVDVSINITFNYDIVALVSFPNQR